MEQIIRKNKDVKFINATEGGANIEGTINMTLQEAIDKYRLDKQIKLNSEQINTSMNYVSIKQNCINELNQIINCTKIIRDKCKKALEVLNDIDRFFKLQNTNMIDKKLKELDKIDKIIKCEIGRASL